MHGSLPKHRHMATAARLNMQRTGYLALSQVGGKMMILGNIAEDWASRRCHGVI